MSIEGDVFAAITAAVEGLSADIVWPRKGEAQPEGEHVRFAFVPNDNLPADITSNVMRRRGFAVLTLVSALKEYQIVSQDDAGDIAANFPRGRRLTRNGITVKIMGHTVRQAREEGGRWETPIWVEYEAWA